MSSGLSELQLVAKAATLGICLDVQASPGRTPIRQRLAWSLFPPASRPQSLIRKRRKILRRLRLANSVGARAERCVPSDFRRSGVAKLRNRRLRPDGEPPNLRFSHCCARSVLLEIQAMPPRTTQQNRRNARNGLVVSPTAKKTPVKVKRKPKGFRASIYSQTTIAPEFGRLIKELEKVFRQPIFLLIQNPPERLREASPYDEIGFSVFKGFQAQRESIEENKPCALLIDSGGGDAHSAYRIARMFQRRTKDLTIIVPQYAKSAATLLALGAKNLVLSRDAELGPLDVQMFDVERESYGSALDAVQALERLNVFALTAVDQSMMLYVARTGKRTDVLLPHILTYVTNFLRPLLEKIDTVEYTRRSRELKVAEDYAVRLMKSNYPFDTAKRIASQLVQRYATHGFVIDRNEARIFQSVTAEQTYGLGLRIVTPPARAERLFQKITPFLDSQTMIGRIEEVP
jgi:Serine dehydrogenase proteinase